jgi:hypothetical protein
MFNFGFGFGVEFSDRAGAALAGLDDVTFRPTSWTAAAFGGPKVAEIEATGGRAALKSILLNWLGYGVNITTPSAGACWWGYVHELSLTIDGAEIVASLETVRNRVAVTYTSLDGAIESALTTAWADDLASQDEYGIIEHFESLGGQVSTAMALAYRDRLLAERARPRLRKAGLGVAGLRAVIRCRGHFAKTGRRYYLRTDGRLENMPSDTLVQPIGWGVTASNQVGFGDGGLHDAWGRFADMAPGIKLAVSGASGSGNNKTYTVLDSTSEEVETYSNNTIYFEPTDDILDAASGMGMVKTDHWLLVGGSADNSRWHRVGAAGADHVRTSASVSGVIEAESTGPTISMYLAQKLATVETSAYEAPGTANITIQHHGQQVAQRFTITAAMKVDRVMVEAGRVGNPGGDFLLRIHADSAGAIGAQLTTGGLAPSSLTEDLAAVWVPVTEITLAAGSYWILVRRADANDGQNYYRAGMTEASYDACQMWTGSAWVAHAPGWRLKFRLWAVEDTGVMAETMLAATIQGMMLDGGFLSGVNGFPAMDAQAVVADELERLAAVGTAAGRRVLASVTQDLRLRLYAQEAADVALRLILRTAGGRLRVEDGVGSPWPAGILPVGMWADLADLDSDLTSVGGLSPAFIEEITYDAASNAWQDVTFAGERSLSDMLKVQAG